MNKLFSIFTIVLGILTAMSVAESADMTARQVLEKSLKAVGGIQNLEKVQSRTGTAKVEVRGLSGTFHVWAKSPDSMKTLLDLQVVQQERGFDGTKGWQKQNSIEEVSGLELARLKRSALFHPLLTYYKNNTPATLKGKEKLGETEVYVVVISPEGAPPESFYIDSKTFLLLRETRAVLVNMQTQQLIIDYSDYRKVENIQLPFQSVQTTGDQVLKLVYDAYQLNPSIEESVFKNPTEQFAGVPYEITLFTNPEKVYKENDGVWEPGPTESWLFHLVIREKHGRALNPVAVRIEFFSDDERLEFVETAGDALETMRDSGFGAFSGIEEVFHLTHSFSRPIGLAIDKMQYRINLISPTGEKFQKSLEIPLQTYEQKTKLIFPLKGNFIVGGGHDINEPHKSERSQHYAYDVLALGPMFELLTGPGTENEHFVTFGKEIIAPADGKVLYARNDVPDNVKPGKVDTPVFLKLPEPERAFLGNSVTLDHGNGEFSSLAHLKFGSVRVKEGDTVKQGDVLGLLGNSGNSDGPHLHYQLMAGPRVFRFDGLPSEFENVYINLFTAGKARIATPRRGVYVTAE